MEETSFSLMKKDSFFLDTPLNPQTNQIRFNQEDLAKLKSGEELYEKLHVPQPKYTTGFMVAGGMSYYGIGKLIFCVGTMNTNCYFKLLITSKKIFKD